MEELRRERAPEPKKETRDPDPAASGGRSLLKASDGRQRLENERWSTGASTRRYGSGR
jgi:hypothetical protein